MTKKLTFLKSLSFLLALFFSFQQQEISAQANFGGRIADTINLVDDFGADPTGTLDASYALIKASRYIENKWNIHGDKLAYTDPDNINYSTHYVRLEIPAGVYKVGTEVSLMSAPYDTFYHKYTVSQPAKTLKYAVLYNDTLPDGTYRNNNEAIEIMPKDLTGCYSMSVYAPKNYYPVELFSISNDTSNMGNLINGVEIVGTGATKSVFKYADGNHVGWMDTLGNSIVPYYTTSPVVVCNNYWLLYHSSADLFSISYCNNIKISNLEIDGNIPHTYYMGSGSDGYQGGAHGLRLNAKHVSLDDLYIHHMQMDGIYLQDRNPDSTTNFFADNIKCEYNRRQGMTWSVGDSVIVNNSEFNYSGRAASLVQSITSMASSPAAGIDFEYGDEGDDPSRKYMIRNGYFTNCKFLDNVGSALINDYDTQSQVRVMNINFFNDTIFNAETYGIHCDGRQFSYTDCGIYGTVLDAGWADSLNGETKFMNCTFEDKPFNGKHWQGYRLVEIVDRTKTLFQNCTFKVNDSARGVFHINWNTVHPNKTDWTVFDNCSVQYNNMGQTDNNNKSYLKWVLFRNKNTVKNILNGLNSFQIFETAHAEIEGSTDPCNPSSLEFEGQVMHQLAYDSPADTLEIGKTAAGGNGYAQYILNDKSIAWPKAGRRLNIGENSSMHIMGGASVYAGGNYYIDGQMIAHANSYVALPDASFYGSSGLMYIDAGCNPNHATTSPLWCNGTGFGTAYPSPLEIFTTNWLNTTTIGTTGIPCVQGGHTVLTSWACSPAYNNVLSKKSISILYNKSVGCFGASNSVIDFEITGGTPLYSYKWDLNTPVTGITTGTNIHLSTNTIGNHTLVVTDASLCIDTFIISLDTAFTYQILKGCVNDTPAQFSTNACDTLIVTGPSGANTTHSGNVYTVHAAGTYTVVAASSTGNLTTTIFIGQCDSCSVADSTAQWFAPNSSVASMFPDGIAPSSPIVMSGNIVVDTTLYIYNNPKVYLSRNTKFDVDSNQGMIVNKSRLRGCGVYWKGITADGNDRRVVVNTNSTIQDMSDGIAIANNAFLQARNSTFLNNASSSIAFVNMNDEHYKGMIWKNVFTSDTNFIPIYGMSKSGSGIIVLNGDYIDIGARTDSTYGNAFTNITNGITLLVTSDVDSTVLTSNTNHIGIYNNTFKGIQRESYGWGAALDSVYTTQKGAGVYIDYSYAPNFNGHTTVSYTGHTIPPVPLFEDCNKAVVSNNNNLIDSQLYINKCVFGIMNNNIMSKECTMKKNRIDSCYMGIQLNGNYHKYFVQSNTMVMNPKLTNCAILYPGVGIDLKHFAGSAISSDTFRVNNNKIILNRGCGKGIATLNGSNRLLIAENEIDFEPDSLYSYFVVTDPSLYGMYSTNCEGTMFDKNVVNGIADPQTYLATQSKGLYFEKSQNCKITCNKVRYTKQGLYAWGNCSTDSTAIQNNKFKFNLNPLYTLDDASAQAGTFGQIGRSTQENGNDWLYNTTDTTWLLGGVYKVWRSSTIPIGDVIKTDTSFLKQNQSGSSGGLSNPYKYLVVNIHDTTYSDACPDPAFLVDPEAEPELDEPLDWHTIDEANAELIAMQQEQYIDYFTTGQWMNTRYLFDKLDTDTSLRNSNSILSDFYDNYRNTYIGVLNDADAALALMFDFKNADRDDMIERYNDAANMNDAISTDGLHYLYEYETNALAIKLAAYGRDSLSEGEKTELEIIANTCPYVGGSAVYKARVLWANFNPLAQYNDRLICIGAGGQGKSGNTGYQNIDSLYEQRDREEAAMLTHQALMQSIPTKQITRSVSDDFSPIFVYPNPASNYIIVNFENTKDGIFILLNALGQEVLREKLNGKHSSARIGLINMANGIYNYKIIFNAEVYIGKLNIIKNE